MNKIIASDDEKHQYDFTLSVQNRLRLTARVAVSVSLMSTLVLVSTLYVLLRDQREENYFQIIQSLTRSQDQLAIAMLIGGALIVLVGGLITWIIALYSSARVAGPLYRFSKNLELEIKQGPVATIGLRQEDSFQGLSDKLARAADGLSRYYDNQLRIVDDLSRRIDSEQGISVNQYSELLQKLRNTRTSLS